MKTPGNFRRRVMDAMAAIAQARQAAGGSNTEEEAPRCGCSGCNRRRIGAGQTNQARQQLIADFEHQLQP